MSIDAGLMVAIRSGCALGRMVESEVVAIIEHLEKLGWTPPAPKAKAAAPVGTVIATPAPAAPVPAPVAVAPASSAPAVAAAPVAPAPAAPVAPPVVAAPAPVAAPVVAAPVVAAVK